jgi:DNA-directed RNA polymerase specialized sigma24 family protein
MTMFTPQPSPVTTLAQRAGRGDPAALQALACHVGALLQAQARRALSRHRGAGLDLDDVAEEVVADVQAFLAGAGGAPGWSRFQESRTGGALDPWLYGIVRNKVRRRLRDARRRERLLLKGGGACDVVASVPEPISPERALDAARALRLARELPPRERAALSLWLEDASSREIASRLRFASPHAVDCCLARGKKRLRMMMGMMMDEPDLPAAA